MAELVYALVLGTSVARLEGSSPSPGTIRPLVEKWRERSEYVSLFRGLKFRPGRQVVRHLSAKEIHGGSIPPQASMTEVVIFIVSFIFPFAYYRILFFTRRKAFEKPVKTKTGLQIHHLHYGLIFMLGATVVLLFTSNKEFTVMLLGVGLGLACDEFISSLKLIEHRPLGLEIYGQSFKSTLIIFLIISFFLLVFGFIRFL